MTGKQNIPALRFPGFEGEWEIEKLDNIAEKIQDGTHFSPKTCDRGPFKYITSRNIRNGFIDLTDVFFITEIEHKEIYTRCDVKFNDVLITKDGAGTGNVCLNTIEEEISLLSSVAFIRANRKRSTNEYIYHYICSPFGQDDINSAVSGQAITRITLSKLKSFKLRFPSLPEQQKIASFLTFVDERIQQLTRKKNFLEQYKKGVMQKIFAHKIIFRDDNEKEFPKWETKKLGDVTELFSRRNKDLIEAEVYSVTNTNGFVLQAEHFDREVAGDDLTNYKIIKKHEFAYNPARVNVGSIAHFKNEIGVISSLYVCFRTNQELRDDFLLYILQLDSTKQKISLYGEGGVRIYLWYPLFASIKIQLPCLEEQQKIATFLTSIDKKIDLVNTQLEKTKTWKKGLLQKMFV